MTYTAQFIGKTAIGLMVAAAIASCDSNPRGGDTGPETTAQVTSGPGGAWTNDATVRKNLATFDTLDFDVYSNQRWDRFGESHAQDIIVTWPDGRQTRGLDKHIEDLKAQFTFAPDTRVKEHPIKLGVGEWTSVMGTMEGTFTKPMRLPDGTLIQPTNKPFKIGMMTIGHWTPQGVMDREWLMWDNADFMKQIGLAD